MNLDEHARPIVVVGVAFASLSAILIRVSDSPPLAIALYRMVFTTALLLPTTVMRRSGRSNLSVRSIALIGLSGVFLAAHFATWITSLSYTSVASAVVLVTLHPIFVAVGSVVILRESVPLTAFFFIVLAILGSALLSFGDLALGDGAVTGNLLAVAGAVSVSGYMLIGRIVRRTVGATLYNFGVYAVAAAVLLPLTVLSGVSLTGYPLEEIGIFFALALFCTIFGHSVFNWALKFVPASFVSTSILLEPIFATAMAIFLFGEIPGVYAAVGGAIVVASLYGVIRVDSARRRRSETIGPASGSGTDIGGIA